MSIRLIVGLGNYKGPYNNTPHNIGFHTLETYAENNHLSWKLEKSCCQVSSFQSKSFLLKPESYMNTSGTAVRWAANYWKIPVQEILIICDDFVLPWGQLRIRRSGSSGGHRGLDSVIEHMGSSDFPRLRVGVGPVPDGVDPKDYVLRKKSSQEIKKLADKVAEAIDILLSEGIERAMNKCNTSGA